MVLDSAASLRNRLALVLILCVGLLVAPAATRGGTPSVEAASYVGDLVVSPRNNRLVRVTGYARDTTASATSVKVRFTVNGRFHTPRYRLADGYYNLPGSSNDWHGFDELIPAPPGWVEVCLQAKTTGPYVELECVSLSNNSAPSGRGRLSGGSWDHIPGTTTNVRYRMSGFDPAWGLLPYGAVQDWNASTRLNLYHVNSNENVTVLLGDYTSSIGFAAGRAYTFPCRGDGFWNPAPEYSSTGCTHTAAYTLINDFVLEIYSHDDPRFLGTIRHEVGHTLGLAHPVGNCCSVMTTENTVTQYDRDSINYLYT